MHNKVCLLNYVNLSARQSGTDGLCCCFAGTKGISFDPWCPAIRYVGRITMISGH